MKKELQSKMTKSELKEWLFNILNENEYIKDISQNKLPDMLQVRTVSGHKYIILIEDFEHMKKKNVNESYAILSLSMSVLGLFDLGIINSKIARRYLTKLSQQIGDEEI